MKLAALCSKPQLVEIKLESEAILKEYGEALEFHTYDRQPLEIFMKLANANGAAPGELIDIVRTLILDEHGKQIIVGERMLPAKVLIDVVAKMVDVLGNYATQPLILTLGEQ